MRKRTAILLAMVLILPAVAVEAARAKNERKQRPEVRILREARTFNDVAEYTGTLAGTISFNTAIYRVDPNASIYQIGRGGVPVGSYVGGRMVTISGVILNGEKIVHSVIIRPERSYRQPDPIVETPLGSGPK